ncbi:energy-coupling factor ABC transporter permease [Vitreoscilla massiliensis]|uniref:Energy-coupling factor ABC transporter permease n=1 Tax=Vitreoscilla massiliensis TaxID=1689272 RepID=A0ABY4E404_9NEIS|nr:energy-coupling factor ABC transporter permease [Vitreoscilla massiliensis]UOO89013.1 energy-coupling factor ABC transporter permease [Vitreoscilla massiliensis]
MVLLDKDVPVALAYAATALLAALLVWVGQERLLWRRLWQGRSVALLLLLLFLWGLSINVSRGASAGLGLHLIGMTLACLMLQARTALGVLLLVCVAFYAPSAWHGQQWLVLPVNVLLAVLPAWLVNMALMALMRRVLPKHLFVFILGNGFVTAGVSMVFTGLCLASALALTGRFSAYVIQQEVLPVFLLLMWGEGFLTGLLVAVMVAFKPTWLDAYSDEVYLPRAPERRW